MKRIKYLTGLFAIVIIAVMSQGCATIFGGRTNTLVFETTQTQQAKIYIDNELVGIAPGKIKLPKEKIQHGSMLEIRLEGHETQEYMILRKFHLWYTIADFVVGALPLAVDYATGDILRPQPRKFFYDLEEVTNKSKSE